MIAVKLGRILCCVLCMMFVIIESYSETIDQFDFKKKFSMTGGLNLNSTYATSLMSEGKTQPFFVGANANLNLQLWGYNAPLSFSYTNKQMTMTNPYNKFTLQPQYKWVRLYIGTSNMSFSKWSYQGLNVNGGGIELTPEKFKLSMFAGKLQSANQTTSTNTNPDRIAMGFKLGSKTKKTTWQAIWFYAYDQGGNINPTTGIPPTYMRNIVGDILIKSSWKRYTFDVNWATSAISQSLGSSEGSSEGLGAYKYHHAMNFGLSRKIYNANVALRYERVAPNYVTLGTTFSGNDMERYFTQLGSSLFKGRLNTNGSLGIERNNLTGLKNNSTSKWVGNMSLSYQLSQKWNMQFSGSNLLNIQQTKRSVKSVSSANLETLTEMRQTNHNANMGFQYTGEGDNPNSFSTNMTYQRTDSKAIGSEEQSPDWSDNYGLTSSFMHHSNSIQADMSYNASLMKAISPNVKNDQLNMGVNISKKSKKDMTHNLNMSYTYAAQEASKTGSVALSYTTNYQFKTDTSTPLGTINFSLSMNTLFEGILGKRQQQDLNFTMGYQYQLTPEKKEQKLP